MSLAPEAAFASEVATIDVLFRDARPTRAERAHDPEGTEAKRVAAIEKLWCLYWCSASRDPNLNRELRDFFLDQFGNLLRKILEVPHSSEAIVSDQIPDPATLVNEFFHGHTRPRRGRPKVSDNENLDVAVEVQLLVDLGQSVQNACSEVANRGGRSGSWETVRDIYYGTGDSVAKEHWKRKVRAAIIWTLPEYQSDIRE